MSDPLILKVSRLRSDARLPTKAHATDAGWDLYAVGHRSLWGAGVYRMPTGLAIELPPGWYAQIFGRSSLAAKGVHPIGGVIDSGFRGEWTVCLIVPDLERMVIQPGDKIAQFVLLPVPEAVVVEADGLEPTSRGVGGFGSTGR